MTWRRIDGDACDLRTACSRKPPWLAPVAVRRLAVQRHDRARADVRPARSVRGSDGQGCLAGVVLLLLFGTLSGAEFRHADAGFLALLSFLGIIGG